VPRLATPPLLTWKHPRGSRCTEARTYKLRPDEGFEFVHTAGKEGLEFSSPPPALPTSHRQATGFHITVSYGRGVTITVVGHPRARLTTRHPFHGRIASYAVSNFGFSIPVLLRHQYNSCAHSMIGIGRIVARRRSWVAGEAE